MDAKQIGEVIKKARKRKGMTQKQLGVDYLHKAMAVIRAEIDNEE